MLSPSYASSSDGPNVGEHQIGFGGRLPVFLLLPLAECIELPHFYPVCSEQETLGYFTKQFVNLLAFEFG